MVRRVLMAAVFALRAPVRVTRRMRIASVAVFWCAGGVAGEYGSGGRFRVDRVALAALAAQPPVGAGYLQDGDVLGVQIPGEAGSVGAGAFHAYCL